VAGTTTSVLEARMNLGHEPEVLREIFREETWRHERQRDMYVSNIHEIEMLARSVAV